tara:strand:- start:588 stop:1019 length:432 start_codon:yes stop_codon:yes gene_type:complete
MIINCQKCNKNFKVDDDLIPPQGRLLKCGNCGNSWFYENNKEKIKDINIFNKTDVYNVEKEINLKANLNKKIKSSSTKNKRENFLKNFFNYFIVILILFISILLIVDTFKIQISFVLPGIIPLLDNLYATIYDLKLFIIDLFN